MFSKHSAFEGFSMLAGTGIAAATAAGITSVARGKIRGAPGVSSSLSTLGKPFGGGMLTGIAVAAGAGALTGIIVYRGLSRSGV